MQWIEQVTRGDDYPEERKDIQLDRAFPDAEYEHWVVEIDGSEEDVVMMEDYSGVKGATEDHHYQLWFNAWPRLMENTPNNRSALYYTSLEDPAPVSNSALELGIHWSCTAGGASCPVQLVSDGQVDLPPTLGP